jgi:hypothetical protein
MTTDQDVQPENPSGNSSEQTVQPTNLYHDVVKYLQEHLGAQTVATLRRTLRPSTAEQKFYYTIDGMVLTGALIRKSNGVVLGNAPVDTTDPLAEYNYLPDFLKQSQFQKWVNGLSKEEAEEIKKDGLHTDSERDTKRKLLHWLMTMDTRSL